MDGLSKLMGMSFRDARIGMHLDQRQLAFLLGVSKRTMNNIENGTGSQISLYNALLICQVLRIAIDDLRKLFISVRFSDEMSKLPKDIREQLIELLKKEGMGDQ